MQPCAQRAHGPRAGEGGKVPPHRLGAPTSNQTGRRSPAVQSSPPSSEWPLSQWPICRSQVLLVQALEPHLPASWFASSRPLWGGLSPPMQSLPPICREQVSGDRCGVLVGHGGRLRIRDLLLCKRVCRCCHTCWHGDTALTTTRSNLLSSLWDPAHHRETQSSVALLHSSP